MTATGGPGRDTVVRAAPDHLATWPDAATEHAPEVHDTDLAPGFDLAEWAAAARAAHPEAVLAATHRGCGPALDGWIDLVRRAAGEKLGGADRAFTGDTTPTSLRHLRRWTSSQLDSPPELVDDAVLVVSELATNVERHARSWLTVDVVALDDAVLLAVTDPDVDSLPALREVQPDEPSGRGLLVVSTLASWWGVIVRPRTKTVWAALHRGATTAAHDGGRTNEEQR